MEQRMPIYRLAGEQLLAKFLYMHVVEFNL